MTIDEHIKTFKDHFYRARVYFPEYCSGLLWIIRDLFLAFSLAMIKLTVYSMVGASLQGAALVGAIKYVRSLEEGAPITLKGISIAIHGGQNLLPAVLMLFLLLALSAWILYRAKVVLIKLIADYHIYNLKRALSLFGTVVPGQSSPRDPSEALQFITSTITQDVQKIVMLVRFFGQSLPSLVILFYAFPILVYIDLSMTLLLMAVGILFLPFFYQANIMAYESDLLGKRAGPESKKILKSLMEEIKDFQHISPKQIKSINKAFRRGELKNKINTLPLFLQSLARTEFLTNMLLSLAVSLVIVTQVPGALAGETRWSKLIAYILFLRLGVGSFKALMGFLTKFSRFYPYVVRYQNFVQSSHAAKSPDERIFIKAAPHGVSELDTPIQIYRPEFLALITGVPLSRYSFPYMVKLGTRSDNGIFVSLEDCFFIGPRGLPQKDGCLREMLGLADHFSAEDLKQAIPVDLLQELKTHFNLNLDKNYGPDKWAKLALPRRIELGIVAALLSPAKIVILERDSLLQIPESRRQEILEQLRIQKPLTVISYPESELQNEAPGCKFGEALCAVTGSTSNILALGSPGWIARNRNEILDLLTREQVRHSKTGDGSDGEEFEDFDDD